MHFVAVVKKNEKKSRENNCKLVPLAICDTFFTDIVVPWERLVEIDQELIPVAIFDPISS